MLACQAAVGTSFNGRTHGSGPWNRGSNPCVPAKIPVDKQDVRGSVTTTLNDLKGFEHLFRHKIAITINAKREALGTKPGASKIYGPEGIRTLDLYSAIVALSQLSYRPGQRRIVSSRVGPVKASGPISEALSICDPACLFSSTSQVMKEPALITRRHPR